MPILAIRFSTRSFQSNGKRGFHDGTDRETHTHTHTTQGHPNIDSKLETEWAKWADAVKSS